MRPPPRALNTPHPRRLRGGSAQIDLPAVQHAFAAAVLALGKPTVLFLMNAGAVAIEPEMAAANQLAIIEAFYPGLRGGTALAQVGRGGRTVAVLEPSPLCCTQRGSIGERRGGRRVCGGRVRE